MIGACLRCGGAQGNGGGCGGAERDAEEGDVRDMRVEGDGDYVGVLRGCLREVEWNGAWILTWAWMGVGRCCGRGSGGNGRTGREGMDGQR